MLRRSGHAGPVAGLIVAALLTSGVTAGAQSEVPAATVAPAPTPLDTDRSTVLAIVHSSVGEIQLCRLAAGKTQNSDVRSFCRNTENDHAHTALAGLQLAQTLGVTDLALTPSPGTPAALETLGRYRGHDFDREFFLTQIEDHENDQDTLRYAAQVANSPAVRQYEDTVLPRVRKDLQMAESALHTIGENDP